MIFCFSGTGNTKRVAGLLAGLLGERVVMVGAKDERMSYDIGADERVVWMFPVHSWGVPPVMRRFMRNVELRGEVADVKHYMVCTCGDDTGLTHEMWRKEMRRRGWRGVAAHSVTMPNTYVLLPGFDVDTADVEAGKLQAMSEMVRRVARAIKCASPIDDVLKGKCAWLKTRVVYPLFMRYMMSPKPLHATGECVGCGGCAKVCPLSNIEMVDGRPCWGDNCAMCLGCYHACARHAVAYGSRTAKKGQYRLK